MPTTKNPTSEINIERADGAGAYVNEIDLNNPLRDHDVKAMREALGQYGVLFFHGQNLTPESHIALAEQFGAININRFFGHVEGYPMIAEVRKEPEQSDNIGGEWHTDHSYDIAPALGSILVARETPPLGGDTLFANMYTAYEALSEGMQRTLETLSAVHSSRHVFGEQGSYQDGSVDVKSSMGNAKAATQDSIHPIIIKHPISKRKALYVNPGFTIGISGWKKKESEALLSFLYQHASRPEFTHRFKWRNGSIAFWDNRATWHYALNDYQGQRRIMHRITVEGEPLAA